MVTTQLMQRADSICIYRNFFRALERACRSYNPNYRPKANPGT